MDIGQITSQLSGQSQSAQKGLAQDFDTFLTLLTTQLKNQDPLEPTDSNEFTRQLVAFAGVEQQINANKQLENLAALTAFQQNSAAVGYLGNIATVQGNTNNFDGHSPVSFEYELPGTANSTNLEIRDANGDLVHQENGKTTFGIHKMDWDGTDISGNPLPAGTYSLTVRALDNDGKVMDSSTFLRAEVTEVETSGLMPILTVGGKTYSLDQILAVSKAREGGSSPTQ